MINDQTEISAAVEADDPAHLRALAAQHRADAAAAKAEAAARFEAVQVEAARQLTEAKQAVQQAVQQIMRAEREAGDLVARAAALEHAEALRQQVDDTAATVVALHGEAEDLAEQVAALDHRLGELATERTTIAAQLDAARTSSDVDQVTALRTRLVALDEVASALTGQREAAQARLTAIGAADGAGELNSATEAWQATQGELRRAQNALDPTRPEARMDAALDEFRATFAANAARIHEAQVPQQPHRSVLMRG